MRVPAAGAGKSPAGQYFGPMREPLGLRVGGRYPTTTATAAESNSTQCVNCVMLRQQVNRYAYTHTHLKEGAEVSCQLLRCWQCNHINQQGSFVCVITSTSPPISHQPPHCLPKKVKTEQKGQVAMSVVSSVNIQRIIKQPPCDFRDTRHQI